MQDPLKERLTGAAILVVVVVLAVPEMFRGPVIRTASSSAPQVPSAEPLRTYRMPDAGPVPTAEPNPPPAADGDAAPPLTAGPEQPLPAPGSTPADAATQQQRPAPPVATAAPEPEKPSRAPVSQGAWAVQVGSFHVRELAERMAREVRAKGFKVHVAGPDERGLFRVRSALQPDKAAALALKQQMTARGLRPIVNASP